MKGSKTYLRSFASKVSYSVLLFVLVFTSLFPLLPQTAHATAPDITASGDLHGYAYSSTIGWISLNCMEGSGQGPITAANTCASNSYKVSANSGVFSGVAWSMNIGWVGFNESDLIGCPGTAPRAGTINPTTGVVTGWARVLSGSVTSGTDWDGCISLGGTTVGGSAPYGLAYDVTGTSSAGSAGTLPGHSLSGFAWGDKNVGWLKFANTSIAFTDNSVHLYVNYAGSLYPSTSPVTISSSGGTFYLDWQTNGMGATCPSSTSTPTTTSAWTGSKPSQNPSDWTTVMANTSYPITLPGNTTSLPKTYTYTLGCNAVDGTGSVTDTVTVIVPPPTSYACNLSPAYLVVPASATAGSGTASFTGGVVWTGSGSPTLSLSLDTGTTGVTAAFAGGGTTTSISPGVPFNVSVSWPTGFAPTAGYVTFPVSASTTVSGTAVSCTDGTIKVTAPAPVTTHHHLPWIEF